LFYRFVARRKDGGTPLEFSVSRSTERHAVKLAFSSPSQNPATRYLNGDGDTLKVEPPPLTCLPFLPAGKSLILILFSLFFCVFILILWFDFSLRVSMKNFMDISPSRQAPF
jgi:hypothetical protein